MMTCLDIEIIDSFGIIDTRDSHGIGETRTYIKAIVIRAFAVFRKKTLAWGKKPLVKKTDLTAMAVAR